MMAQTIKQLVEGTNEISADGNPPLRVYIVILVIPCILLGMITSLKYLAPFSIIADFIISKFSSCFIRLLVCLIWSEA